MASSNRLSELASIIQKNSARIDEHVSSELTTSTSITPTTRDEILGWQTAVLNATDELRSLVVDQVGTHQEVISDQNPLQLAYLGMGVMGKAMSKNLAQKGNLSKPIILWNRTMSRAVSHSSAIGNATVAESLSEAVSKSDIIWSCFSDQKAVISSFDVILNTDVRGKLFLECSTITPEGTNELADRVISAGGEFVAMPVFGERSMANAGILTCVPAGEIASVGRILPFLQGVIGRHVINLSSAAPGIASQLKLIGNVLVVGMVESVATAHVLAEKSGMDANRVHEVIVACFPKPFATYSNRMSSGDYYRDEPIANVTMVKEITDHVLELAKESGMQLQVYEIGCKHLEDVQKHVGANGDISAIYGALRVENGLNFRN